MDNDDYLYLRPLDRDERLIQSLIRFGNAVYQPGPEATQLQPSVYQRQESSRNRLNLFIDETCKSVVNASCPIDDYPQQYQLNQQQQYQLNQQQQYQPNQQQHYQSSQQQIENVSNQRFEDVPNQAGQNSQYQIVQMTACPQFYQPVHSAAKLNTLYNPGPAYYLDSSALINPLPNTNPCFRIVSSQSDLDCQLMEPPIIPPATVQSSQAVRRPLGEIQNQFKFNQQPPVTDEYGRPFVDSYDPCYPYDSYGSQHLTCSSAWPTNDRFAAELNTKNTSTQRQPNPLQPSEVPAQFSILPDSLVGYFKAGHTQSSEEISQSQKEIETCLANSQELNEILNYSKKACSRVRYSPKQLLYLNGLERLGNDEIGKKLRLKPAQDQVKRIQKKNRQLRTIKFKNRDTKNVGLRQLFSDARKQDLDARVQRIKHLILDLEPKLMNQ